MGFFSSVLSIGGSILGGIYGGPAGATAGGAIGGALGGAVEGGDKGPSASDTFGAVGSAIPGLVGGINQQNATNQGNALSQYAIDQQIAGQRETNAQNVAEALKNREFQYEMSSTAHTREVRDLKAAGLNPILSATGGSGASTGSGSLATVQNPYEGMAGNVNEARKIKEIAAKQLENEQQRVNNENKLASSAINLNRAKEKEADSSTALNTEAALLKVLEMDTEKQRASKTLAENYELMSRVNMNSAYTARAHMEERLQKLRGDHENLSLKERDYLSPLKKWTGPARDIFNTAEDAVDIINPFNSRTTIHRYE